MTAVESPIVLPDDPDFGPEVQLDYPGYRSTRLRVPKRPLVTLPEEFHALELLETGELFPGIEDAHAELAEQPSNQVEQFRRLRQRAPALPH